MTSHSTETTGAMSPLIVNHSAQPPVHANPPAAFNFHIVLSAVRCWWKMATPVALILAVVAGGVIYYLHTPQYTASCELLIKEKADVILNSLGADSTRFINNQIEIMRSQRLLGPLLSRPEIASTPELAQEEDKVAALARRLKIAVKGKSDFFLMSFTSESPKKSELVVKATSEAYWDFYRKRESEQDDLILQLLEKERVIRFKEMNALHESLRAMTINLTGVDPFRSKNKVEAPETAANPFAGLQSEIVRLQVDQNVLVALIEDAEKTAAAGDFKIPAEELEQRAEAHPAIAAIRADIEQLQEREDKYHETAKDVSSSPLFKQLLADIDARLRDIDARKPKLRREIAEALKGGYAAAQSERIEKLKQDWNEGNAKLTALRKSVEQALEGVTTAAKQYAGVNFELESLQNKFNEVSSIYKEISNRILIISTEQRAPERVEIFRPATLPAVPDEIVPWKKIAMGMGAAFLVPFALSIGWEQFFRRVTSRGQLESVNRLCVVGEVASLPARRRGATQRNRTERNVLLFEESVDSLRTHLCLGKSQGLRVLAITSAVSQEGKTTLAAQLAVSIARATGEMTLLIDGDMRSPEIHRIFDTDLSPGLTEVLKGECPVEEAIETGYSEKLHVFTAGRLTGTPHQLLGNGEFSSLLKKLSEIYRHIIIDTPPILPASEALVMARAADSAILCARRDYSRMDQVDEAYRRMTAAGVDTAGAVLNGLPLRHYAFKYGNYGYDRPLASSVD